MNETQYLSESTMNQNLKHYGLNPFDWKITPTHEDCYVIESIDDPEFSFFARICHEAKTFELHLRSL